MTRTRSTLATGLVAGIIAAVLLIAPWGYSSGAHDQTWPARSVSGNVYQDASFSDRRIDNFTIGSPCDDSVQSGLASAFKSYFTVAMFGDDGRVVDFVTTGAPVVGYVGTITVQCFFPFVLQMDEGQRFAQLLVDDGYQIDPSASRYIFTREDVDRLTVRDRGFLLPAPEDAP